MTPNLPKKAHHGAALAMLLTAGLARGEEPQFHTGDARVALNGLWGSSLRVEGSDNDGLDHSVGLAFRTLGYGQDGWVTVHREEHGHIGGGTAGFDGELGLLLRGGIRLPIGPTHGPLVRGGIQLYVGGNDRLYHSMLELPHGQLGYQVLTDAMLLELSLQGGFTLLGHFAAGDEAERSLGQVPDWGAALALHVDPVRFDLWWRRFQPGEEGNADGPIDTGRAQICGTAWYLAVCSEARLAVGNQRLGAGRGSTGVAARQLMLTIGVGSVTTRNHVRGRD